MECVSTANKFGIVEMKNKQTIFLEVWHGYRGFAWVERKFGTIHQFKNEYDYTYVFMGKTAVVYIGTEDFEMTRDEALKIATDQVKGNIIILDIDLSVCGGLPPRLRKKTTP